jgi:hypothetical protein
MTKLILAIAAVACGGGHNTPPDGVPVDDGITTCSLLTQMGCQPNEKCTWIIDDVAMNLGHIGCAPDIGTVGDGMGCSFKPPGQGGFDDCIKGHFCFGDDSTGVCKTICDQQGGAPMCTGTFTCKVYDGLFGPPHMETAGVCDATCSPLDDNLFGKATKIGTACAMTQGCYPQFSHIPSRPSSASCAEVPMKSTLLFQLSACTTTNGCLNPNGQPFANGCGQGFHAVIRDNTTGANSFACRSLCKLADCSAVGCGATNGDFIGLAPHRCNSADSSGTFILNTPGKADGENCVATWLMERDAATGHIATSPFSDVLGLCLAHKDFRYDSNNDGQITVDDATWPDCSSLPIVEPTPDAPSARKFGCVTATTSRYPLGFTSTPLVELPRLPYGETLRRQ